MLGVAMTIVTFWLAVRKLAVTCMWIHRKVIHCLT